MRAMQTVVLDTNALLMPFEIKMNLDLALRELLGEARIVVPGPLVGELKHLDHKFAGAALSLARKYEIIPTEASGDSSQGAQAQAQEGEGPHNLPEVRHPSRHRYIPGRVIHAHPGMYWLALPLCLNSSQGVSDDFLDSSLTRSSGFLIICYEMKRSVF